MRRSRIITQAKDLSEEKGPNRPEGVEKPVGEHRLATVEELVAISCGEIKNQAVFNGKGEKLGKIEDLMIDLNSGRIAYAVLSFGGFLGLGNKLFAIPWEFLCVDNRWNYHDIYQQRIVLNILKEKLEKAPGFDRNNWPREPDWAWLKEVFTYYGCQPYWAPPEEANKPQPPSS